MSSRTNEEQPPTVANLDVGSEDRSYSVLFGTDAGAAIETSTLGEWAASLVRLALVLFAGSMYLLVVDKAGTIPWLAYAILVGAGVYSAWLLAFEPYRHWDFLASSTFVSLADTTLIVLWLYATGGFASQFYPLLYASVVAFSFRYGAWESLAGALLHAGGYAGLLYAAGELAPNIVDAAIRIGFIFMLAALGALFSIVTHSQTVAKQAYQDVAERLEEARERVQAHAEDLEERGRQLQQSNEDLKQVTYAISHDVREPLRVIAGYVNLLEERGRDHLDEATLELIDQVETSVERLDRMVDDLLTYSRVQRAPGEMEVVELDQVVDDALEHLSLQVEESQATVERGALPAVRGQESQLTLLMQNLIANAIKYSGDAPPHIEVGADRVGDKIELWVEDQGVGIPENEQEGIFEIFRQGTAGHKVGGEGIGLALCQRIAERHGGEIDVASEEGEGTRFTVRLSAVDG